VRQCQFSLNPRYASYSLCKSEGCLGLYAALVVTTRTAPPAPLRKDSRRNRAALLAAARTAFAEEGLDAALEGIARRAGVAIGTLYRHFPTRMDLVGAVIVEKKRAWIKAAEAAVVM